MPSEIRIECSALSEDGHALLKRVAESLRLLERAERHAEPRDSLGVLFWAYEYSASAEQFLEGRRILKVAKDIIGGGRPVADALGREPFLEVWPRLRVMLLDKVEDILRRGHCCSDCLHCQLVDVVGPTAAAECATVCL